MTPSHWLVLAVDFLPRVGGVSTLSHHLADALAAKNGASCTVLAPIGSSSVAEAAHYEVCWDTAARPRLRGALNRALEDRRITRLLKALINERRITHVLATHPHYYALPAMLLCKQMGLPFGVYMHGFELRSALMDTDRRAWQRLVPSSALATRSERVRRVGHGSDVVFCNSRYTAALMHSQAVTCVVGCGLSSCDVASMLPYDPDQKKQLQKALGVSDRHASIVYLGRLVPSKNVTALLRALQFLPHAELFVLGDGPERQRLLRDAQRFGVGYRVHWLGQVDETKKRQLLASADVMCLPSIECRNGAVEGFGIALLEAMAAGTPVVANRSGGMVDVVIHKETGLLCNADDAQDLAAAIESLINDRAMAQSLVAQAQERIRSHFNWDRVAHRVELALA